MPSIANGAGVLSCGPNTSGTFGFIFFGALVLELIFFVIKRYVRDVLEAQAYHDSLTSLYNRRVFNDRLKEEMARSYRTGKSLALIFFDIDFFKKINDNYGHQKGDEVLRSIASLTSDIKRYTDILCRIGGEEFALITPQTDLAGAQVVADKIRVGIEHNKLGLEQGAVTISAGVTMYREGDTEVSLYQRADKALYRAKESGRNLVVADGT